MESEAEVQVSEAVMQKLSGMDTVSGEHDSFTLPILALIGLTKSHAFQTVALDNTAQVFFNQPLSWTVQTVTSWQVPQVAADMAGLSAHMHSQA